MIKIGDELPKLSQK